MTLFSMYNKAKVLPLTILMKIIYLHYITVNM